ncbi:ABC transporter permease subunit [Blautia liquoris]|uniref:ABC transporter permease subunit n=1 Tax=Blautia liquoris TaxID=2779518 RepID=A0A7M2RJL8_9FIRM|nr:ABC transporter permease subunit [Blautia liquoris]QOV19530.1 ABC transporter permease subunit [Blautia liquoris]
MNEIGTLYVYELKKTFNRKIVWIVGGIMLLLCVFLSLSDLISNSTSYGAEEVSAYERMKINQENARDLSGTVIDHTLQQKVKESTTNVKPKSMQKYAPIYFYMLKIIGNDSMTSEIYFDKLYEELYEEREHQISQNRTDQKLTEKERDIWRNRDAKIKTPFTFEYTDGWSNLWDFAYTINYLLLLMLSICLSNVFSVEHLRKTDAIILCSKYGRKELYFVKILAGITFGVTTALLFFGVTAAASILIYGADGFHAAIQIAFPLCSWNISVGASVVILLFLLIAVAILYSAVIMFLSEILKNSVAVMAIPVGFMILTMLMDVPYQFRSASQIYDLLPTNLLAAWELWDDRLVSILGYYVTNVQIAPIVYLLITLLTLVIGKRIYMKYQVGAR